MSKLRKSLNIKLKGGDKYAQAKSIGPHMKLMRCRARALPALFEDLEDWCRKIVKRGSRRRHRLRDVRERWCKNVLFDT